MNVSRKIVYLRMFLLVQLYLEASIVVGLRREPFLVCFPSSVQSFYDLASRCSTYMHLDSLDVADHEGMETWQIEESSPYAVLSQQYQHFISYLYCINCGFYPSEL